MATAASKKSEMDIVAEVSRVVMDITGVQLGEPQRLMVQNRLKKRISDLGLRSEAEYAAYFQQNRPSEVEAMVSLLTTHHTYFFREFAHFEYLLERLPDLIAMVRKRGDRTIRVWSAACSRGQEVYSLAMLLANSLARMAPDVSYEILGTDVDPSSVEIARNGVYKWNEIKSVPSAFLRENWSRGKGEIADFVRAKESIRSSCHFETMNLIHFDDRFLALHYDVIFCRNVFIYFTGPQILEISRRLAQRLTPGGLFFIGISESLIGLDLPLEICGPSIYVTKAHKPSINPSVPPQATASKSKSETLKVFCVDDSPSIIALLKQILQKEEGFEVVGTASNGLEATQKLKSMTVDLITLDIHMPQQNGLEYLRSLPSAAHPPVVVISSVAREDADLAVSCLEAGAVDYVEKPTLERLAEKGEEIRMKLRAAYRGREAAALAPKAAMTPGPEREFAMKAPPIIPEKALRVIVGGVGHRLKILALLRDLQGQPQAPLLIVMEGLGQALPALAKALSRDSGREIQCLAESGKALQAGQIQLIDPKSLEEIRAFYQGRRISILVFGAVTRATRDRLGFWKGAQVLVDDEGQGWSGSPLAQSAHDIVPSTSFAYMSQSYLSQAYERA